MTGSVTVTPYESQDREAVLALAPRLCTGVAAWRPNDGVRSALREWFARGRDIERITLETGAANVRARSFYGALGYREEEIRLTRVLAKP
jgi:hypothetical protein